MLEQAQLAPGAGAVPVSLGPRPNGRRLSYLDARQSPCTDCPTSPCCTYLLLQTIRFETLTDVDHAVYLLNFEGIILGLHPDGHAQVYLYQPCGNLDVPSGLCRVHGTPEQPSICVHYNAHSCGYRHSMIDDTHPGSPLMDRRRMAWYADRLAFDDDRKVVTGPPWEEVLDAFRSMPVDRRPAPPPPPDPVREEWRSIVLAQKAPTSRAEELHRFSEPVVSDPCRGCDAYCCKTLVFPRPRPENASQVDMFRYCLGFPGVEIGVSDDGWAVLVRTTCRHLEANRCSVYGTEERPLKCGYYDAMKCTYKKHFGTPEPESIARVTRDQFDVLAGLIQFDDLGEVRAFAPLDVLKDFLGQVERARSQRR